MTERRCATCRNGAPRSAVRIGSEEHKELFCGTFIKSHLAYEPRELPWPELDDVSLARLRAIPIWSIALQVELNAGLVPGHVGIEAQIETTRGLINVEEICAASPRLETIIFGPADFAASMEMPVLTGGVQIPEYPGDHFHYVFSKILMAGRANGLQVIDGPFLKIREHDAFREYCNRTKILGYDGKWALNPAQAEVLNEVFSPRQEDFDKASAILTAYAQATDREGKGAVILGEEMIDEASRRLAAVTVERGRAFRMTARPWPARS